MGNKTYILRFRKVNRDIFNAVKAGKKKVETRVATKRYRNIKTGDKLVLVCGENRLKKSVTSVEIYKTISALIKKYKPSDINPNISSKAELEKMYYSFPGYREKIKTHGLVVIHLK